MGGTYRLSGVPKPRFLDPAEIEKTIAYLINQDFSFALVGGVAMQVYGSTRFTEDVDVVADEDAGAPELRKIRPLGFGGTRYSYHDIPVDIIVRNDGYRELYTDALKTAWALEPTGLVVDPEHLTVMKFVADRDKDKLDFQWLATSGKVDLAKARNLVFRFLGGQFAVERFDTAVAEAEFKKTREGD